MTIILGIDPGSRITGYGVVRCEGNRTHYVASGCIKIAQKELDQKLKTIYDSLSEVIMTYLPEEAAVEQVFFHENANSALKLGQARGAIITAISVHEMTFAEYSARQVKKAVVGYGAAKKDQVQQMVKTLLNLTKKPQEDAADALAIALCHAYTRGGLAAYKGAAKKMAHGRLR